MERCARVDTKTDRQINGITTNESPAGEVQRLLECVPRLTRSADQEDPERLDAVALYTLRYLTNLGGVESLFEFCQHRIASTLSGDSQRAKSGRLHCAQKLRRRRSGGEIGRIELDPKFAASDCLADLQRVTGW